MAGGGSALGLNHLDTGVHHVPIEVNGKLFMQHGNETKVVGIRSTWLQLTHIEICSYLLISKGPTLEPASPQSQSVQNIWKAYDQTTKSWLRFTIWKQFYSIEGKYKHWYCTHNFLKPVVQMAMYEPLTFDLLLAQNGVELEIQNPTVVLWSDTTKWIPAAL